MDRRGGSLARRWLLAACVGLVVSCGIAGALALRGPASTMRAQRLAEARSRWDTRAVPHYRLVMRAPSWCRLDVEIMHERLVKVFENTCPNAPQTVSSLFELIGRLDSSADVIFCAPHGCECTEVRYAQAVYDTQLGFPRSIRLRRQRQANWPELWRFFASRGVPNCLTPRDLDLVEVISLKPIT
jgi:hypothetical protein